MHTGLAATIGLCCTFAPGSLLRPMPAPLVGTIAFALLDGHPDAPPDTPHDAPKEASSRSPAPAPTTAKGNDGGDGDGAAPGAAGRPTSANPGGEAVRVDGLLHAANVDVDDHGIPLVQAATMEDAIRLQGFLHAQDRFAQMDMTRRFAAGELAEIASALALPIDRQQRPLRLRRVAQRALAALPAEDRHLLEVYAEGVNAGVAAMPAPPPEYGFLKAPMAPWRAEDSLLIGLFMAAMLNDSAREEIEWEAVQAALPAELIAFLDPRTSRWDAPILPDAPADRAAAKVALPGPEVVDTRPLRAAWHEAGAGPTRTAVLATAITQAATDATTRSMQSAEDRPAAMPGQTARVALPPSSSSAGRIASTPAEDRGREPWAQALGVEDAPARTGDRPDAPTRPHDAGPATGPIIEDAFHLAPWLPRQSEAERAGDSAAMGPIGSNGWAVNGPRTDGGRAILVNDMHLQITVPGIWYRISLMFDAGHGAPQQSDAGPATWRLDGVSLPGVPGLISGSNGHVAWGFTNVEADFIDFVKIDEVPGHADLYQVPGGTEPFTVDTEILHVLGGEPEQLAVRSTRWGPVVAASMDGHLLSIVWTAMLPDGLDVDLLHLSTARTVDEALTIVRGWRGPQQNVLLADGDGHIAWTIGGYLPKRVGLDGRTPTSWADGTRRWDGERDESERPMVRDPADGVLVTANQRTVALPDADRFGRMWAVPERAYRIRERALSATGLDEKGCSDIQLDITSLRFMLWRDAVLPSIQHAGEATPAAADRAAADRVKRAAALAKLLHGWDGTASVDTKVFGVLRAARTRIVSDIGNALVEAVLAKRQPGLAPAKRKDEAERLARGWMSDESIVRIIEERPDHLLPPGFPGWDEFIASAVLDAANTVRDTAGLRRWGDLNASDFAHPLARAAPMLASAFSIPRHEQPGHSTTVRVSGTSYGASDRLVVSPGREELGLLAIPTGQSGNPTSPHFRDLHASWRDGTYLPLRPQQQAGRRRFEPSGGRSTDQRAPSAS